jgi:hypothetical protein
MSVTTQWVPKATPIKGQMPPNWCGLNEKFMWNNVREALAG